MVVEMECVVFGNGLMNTRFFNFVSGSIDLPIGLCISNGKPPTTDNRVTLKEEETFFDTFICFLLNVLLTGHYFLMIWPKCWQKRSRLCVPLHFWLEYQVLTCSKIWAGRRKGLLFWFIHFGSREADRICRWWSEERNFHWLLIKWYFFLVTRYFLLATRYFLLTIHYFWLVSCYFLLATLWYLLFIYYLFTSYLLLVTRSLLGIWSQLKVNRYSLLKLPKLLISNRARKSTSIHLE